MSITIRPFNKHLVTVTTVFLMFYISPLLVAVIARFQMFDDIYILQMFYSVWSFGPRPFFFSCLLRFVVVERM